MMISGSRLFVRAYTRETFPTDSNDVLFTTASQVEPSHRAYSQLNVRAVLTGRRRSQGSERAALPVVEIDSTGLIKINPLIEWSFKQVKDFIDAE